MDIKLDSHFGVLAFVNLWYRLALGLGLGHGLRLRPAMSSTLIAVAVAVAVVLAVSKSDGGWEMLKDCFEQLCESKVRSCARGGA